MNFGRLRFGAVLVVTMASTTMAITTFGVLASELIAAMGIERWQLGMLATSGTLSGALFSTRLGKWVDVVGGKRATVTTLMVGGTALFCVGVAPEFSLMVGAAFLNGIASGIANPATNKLISLEVEPGRRGLIVGIKQSGVQVAIFMGGWLLPVFTDWWGWRWAVLAFAAAPLTVGAISMARGASVGPPSGRPPDKEAGRKDTNEESPVRLPRVVRRLTVYGFLLGMGVVVLVVYLPLYAEEVLGMSRGRVGLVLAITGPVGILARIGWGRIAEGRLGMVRSLMLIASLGVVSGVFLAFGEDLGTWVIWVAAVVAGFSVFAWTSVGMLAVIEILPAHLAGTGSGRVYLGFITGFGIGAPLFGWSVDALGVYGPGWLGITALFAAGLWVMFTVRGDETPTRPIGSTA
ncbi:MAG: MFS transporter [bacterium]|nr:MFS transporter [bacterium]MDE0602332.1 MFS transporter [bacterium]